MKSLLQDRTAFDSNRLFWAPCTRQSLPSHFARIVDEVDELGMTPLMWASMYCPDATVISSLIEHGANPKARTKHGVTALHWCAHYNKTNKAGDVAQALLAAGADPAAHAKNGLTPLEWAHDNANAAVAAAITRAASRT